VNAPNTYVRSMKGWWLKHPFYTKYMIRESSALFVTVYALVLLRGLWCLVEGPDAYAGWLDTLTSPGWILFHILAMLLAAYHTGTWFAVSPKVVPHIYIGESRIPDAFITRIQYAIAVVCYLVLLVLVARV